MTTRLPDIPFSSFLYATIVAHLIFIFPIIGGVLLFDLINVKTLFLILALLGLPAIPVSAAFSWLFAKGPNWINTPLAITATCGLPGRMYGILFGGLLGFHFFNSIGGIIGAILFYLLSYVLTSPLSKFISNKVMPETVLQKG